MKTELQSAAKTNFLRKLATLPKLFAALLALTLSASAAHAAPPALAFVVTAGANGPQFGAVDLASGAFLPIGKPEPALLASLAWWKGSLLSIATSDPYAGDVVRINPLNGAMTVVGPTGLGYNAGSLTTIGGKLYLTDFSGNLYTVNPQTGGAALLANSGMPPDNIPPFTTNSDGTLNLADQTFSAFGSSLYVSFDAFNIDPATLALDKSPSNPSISPALYRINPATGAATLVGPTFFQFGATVAINGKLYAIRLSPTGFAGGAPTAFSEVYTLDVSTGHANFLRVIDPAAGTIFGAAPVIP